MTDFTITKYWHKPQIYYTITDESLSFKISLDDFVKAVKTEMGPVMKVFDRVDLHNRIDDLAITILGESLDNTVKTIKEKITPYPLIFTKAEYEEQSRINLEEALKSWATELVDTFSKENTERIKELVNTFNKEDTEWFGTFIQQLKEQIGSVTWTFSKEAFDKQVDTAVANLTVISHDAKVITYSTESVDVPAFLDKILKSLSPLTETLVGAEVDGRLGDYVARVVHEGIVGFIKDLKARIDVVTRVFTKEEFEDKLDEAIIAVVEGIKEESIKVVK